VLTDIHALADHFLIALPNINTNKHVNLRRKILVSIVIGILSVIVLAFILIGSFLDMAV
jgi:hypothetical protein